MKKNSFFSIHLFGYLCLVLCLFLTACDKDDDPVDPGGDEELITTLIIQLVDDNNETLRFAFRDVDGVGGNDATIDTLKLTANTSYTASIEVLNEAENPAEDITTEIRAEAEDHLFIFNPSDANLSVTITDTDSNNAPIGLSSTFVTEAVSTGNLGVSLKHKSDKDNPTSTGETDIEVTFPVVIQ